MDTLKRDSDKRLEMAKKDQGPVYMEVGDPR